MKLALKVVAAQVMLLLVIPFYSINAQKIQSAVTDKAIQSLTLEEKAALLVGAQEILSAPEDSRKIQQNVPGAWAYTHAVTNPRLPALAIADVYGGVRCGKSAAEAKTVFPMPSVLSASWNKTLMHQVGGAMAKEALASGADVLLAPALNVVRHPLSGKNVEYFSEDPELVARLASAMIKGMQAQGIPVCVKYWYVDNQETNRSALNVVADQVTLREIYLKSFEKVIRETRPWGVMAAYPKVNAVYQSEDKSMLTDVLRGQWQYGGVILTDRYAGGDAVAQVEAGVNALLPGSRQQYDSLLSAVRSGRLPEEVLNQRVRELIGAIQQTPSYKKLKPVRPDASANARLAYTAAAESIVLLKNLDDCLPLASQWKKIAFYGVASYHFIQGGSGASVNNSLPQLFMKADYVSDPTVTNTYLTHLKTYLPEEKKPAPAAVPAKPGTPAPANQKDPASVKTQPAAPQAGQAKPAQNAPQAKPAASAKPVTATPAKPATTAKAATATPAKPATPPMSPAERMAADLRKVAEYPFPVQPEELFPSKSALQQHLKTSQLAIITIGRRAEPGKDRKLENGYQLSEEEIRLIRDVCTAYHKWGKKVIVILNVDGIVDVTSWHELPDAILWCGMCGQGGPEALFDILTGKVTPSGKLPCVWPITFDQFPSSAYFPMQYKGVERVPTVGNRFQPTAYPYVDEVPFAEGRQIGYRYFDEHPADVRYSFGYGLSYTTFAYDNQRVERHGDSLIVSVRITNSGTKPGKEVVQVYVAPQRRNREPERPMKILCDFAKTRLLQPGESQVMVMRFAESDLAFYSETNRSWMLEKGSYTVKIGASANDIRSQWPLQFLEDKTF